VRLLVASYAYPPLRYPRAIQVARLVAHLEIDTAVVCASESDAGDRTLLDAYPDRDRIVERVPWSLRSSAISTLRDRVLKERLLVPDRYRPWQWDAGRLIKRQGLLRAGDVLATFGQPMSDHLLGLRLKRSHDVPWIAHLSDPWTDSPFRNSGIVSSTLNQRLERAVFRHADALVFTSEETANLVLSKYPAELRAKGHVVPHAHDPALYRKPTPHEGIIVRYLGNFYGSRGPAPLFKALTLLNTEQPGALRDVRVEIIGSHESPLSTAQLADLPPGVVSVRPPVPYIDSLVLMREADILLVLDAPGPSSMFLPSKLVDYLGAERTIVSVTPEGTAARLTRAANGLHADPEDVAGTAGILADALADVRAGRSRIAPGVLVASYAAPVVAARFAELVRRVARPAR
jgi:hypothetical protein